MTVAEYYRPFQQAINRVLDPSDNPDSGSFCPVVDLRDRPTVACPTCGRVELREAVGV